MREGKALHWHRPFSLQSSFAATPLILRCKSEQQQPSPDKERARSRLIRLIIFIMGREAKDISEGGREGSFAVGAGG